jgi:hypothetical protein
MLTPMSPTSIFLRVASVRWNDDVGVRRRSLSWQ